MIMYHSDNTLLEFIYKLKRNKLNKKNMTSYSIADCYGEFFE